MINRIYSSYRKKASRLKRRIYKKSGAKSHTPAHKLRQNPLVQVDEVSDKLCRGWVFTKDGAGVLRIFSSTDEKLIVCQDYRPDVRRAGQHPTGYCGFSVDISGWSDKDITLDLLGSVDVTPEAHSPLFFVHIPKTAGTSLKRAFKDYLGDDAIWLNYSENSIETAEIVKRHLIGKSNYYGFYQEMLDKNIKLYAGHIPINPGFHVFPSLNIFTVLRNPVDQVISHFNHYCRWYDYDGTIEKFMATRGFADIQTRHLRGIPLQLIGLVGLSERYSEFTATLNDLYGLNIKERFDNNNEVKEVASLTDAQLDIFKENNPSDIALYEAASELFSQRYALDQQGKPWCYGYVDMRTEKEIRGVAFIKDQEDPVEVAVFDMDKELQRTEASGFRAGLVRFKVPRGGFISFSFKAENGFSQENLVVKVIATGQVLTDVYNI